MKKLTIAVDGFSSCGKSSYAKLLAKELDCIYVDTGAMYRAVTLYCIETGVIKDKQIDNNRIDEVLSNIDIDFKKDENGQNITLLNGKDVESEIRSVEVTEMVSPISKIKVVREKLVALQREMSKDVGVVMDGRDIGTVVFPNADIKLFMTASPEIRAERRYKENIEKEMEADFEQIKANIIDRDHQDSNRKESPLRKAEDAIELDNSDMTLEDQMVWFKETFKDKLAG